MHKRFFKPPRISYFLFGPSGTGKSTWLEHHYKGAYRIDLLDPVVLRTFSAYPERLSQVLLEHPEHKIVVIDEVQKAPELLNVVHSLIEKKKGYQFILTGSSARKLMREGVNLLGGRAPIKKMPPFYAGELGKSFDLTKNLRLGMLPVVLDSPEPQEVLRAYAGLYLKEEVQAEGIVRNVGDFARFLETMSTFHAQLINASNIARECQIARKTVDNYLMILEDLLLGFYLEVFSRKARRELSKHQKFYYFDSGVYYSLRPRNHYDNENEQAGPALEGFVAQHLNAWVEAQVEPHQLHFWRTSSGVEVDLIVSGPSCFLAIEVKNSATVHPNDLRGLETFKKDYPDAKLLLLYRGKERYREGNVHCMPVQDFLLRIHPDSPLPESR